MRVAVAVSGRGSNLEALFARLGNGDEARIVLVLSDRPDAPALDRARERNVAALALRDWRSASEWLAALEAHSVDLLVLAGFLKLVPSEVIARYRGRIINVHPALLPAFGGKGMYGIRVHEAVLRSGAAETGCTVHLVEEEYDRGMILAQARVPVLPGDNAEALAARVLEQEHRLLPAVVLAAARAGLPVAIESART
ncbi:MAG: phosphoribosylglycinamide formyltransferase [Gemmatimonadetes bacterium]|nr:phosphoribosylglycinamide formyltransferase [Gemmatimonadota bacterium]